MPLALDILVAVFTYIVSARFGLPWEVNAIKHAQSKGREICNLHLNY